MTTVRLLNLEDSHIVYKEVNISREHLQNLVWTKNATLKTVEDFLALLVNHQTRHLFGIFHHDIFCGCIEIRDKEQSAEIGYWLGHQFRGQGILQDALRQLKDLLSIQTVTAKVKINNIKSYTILHSIFNVEKITQDDVWVYLSN